MTAFVLDSSVALAWLLPEKSAPGAGALLDRVVEAGALVPDLWRVEIADALLSVERSGRISVEQRLQALDALSRLPIALDAETSSHMWGETVTLAATHRLGVTRAAYLELAQRRGLPLATLDRDLAVAAEAGGVRLMGL